MNRNRQEIHVWTPDREKYKLWIFLVPQVRFSCLFGYLNSFGYFCMFWLFWLFGYFEYFFWSYTLNRARPITYPNNMYFTGTWIMDSTWPRSQRNRLEPEPIFFQMSRTRRTRILKLVGSKCRGLEELGPESNRSVPDPKIRVPNLISIIIFCMHFIRVTFVELMKLDLLGRFLATLIL